MLRLLVFVAMASAVIAQVPEPEVYSIGGDVKAPVALSRPEPSYSETARTAGMAGQVLLEIIVDESGLPGQITVISPLGFGLDEEAVRTIQKWTFKPATKDGTPVRVRATVLIAFHLQGADFDRKQERQRSDFNQAVHDLRGTDKKRREKALQRLQDLSKDGYPAAMFAHALLLRQGKELASDPAAAIVLIRRASDKKYGPAIYEIGRMHLRGEGMPLDADKGRDMIVTSANLGSDAAQYFLGVSYEFGTDGYEKSGDSARQFFRLCAATGRQECQLRLGNLLLKRTGRRETDFTQAIGWLELARDQGSEDARSVLAALQAPLTEKQRSDVDQLKPKLARKN